MTQAVLQVRNLRVEFPTAAGYAPVVDGISFDVAAGETLAVVGESGCGKSVTAMAIMRVLAEPPARIRSGTVLLDGRDVMGRSEEEMRRVRGRELAMIFQEPMTCLNPVLSIGEQLAETLVSHRGLTWAQAREEAIGLLEQVRISDPRQRLTDYPHRLSGGMRQRVMIAMAIACKPKLLIADEPTTALDVTVQAQILALLRRLQQTYGAAMLLITHNLAVVAQVAHRVAVMYAGRIVETGPVRSVLKSPQHPFTLGLIGATPGFSATGTGQARARLADIGGMVPPAGQLPLGCAFAPRCFRAVEKCREERPALATVKNDHDAACFLPGSEVPT